MTYLLWWAKQQSVVLTFEHDQWVLALHIIGEWDTQPTCAVVILLYIQAFCVRGGFLSPIPHMGLAIWVQGSYWDIELDTGRILGNSSGNSFAVWNRKWPVRHRDGSLCTFKSMCLFLHSPFSSTPSSFNKPLPSGSQFSWFHSQHCDHWKCLVLACLVFSLWGGQGLGFASYKYILLDFPIPLSCLWLLCFWLHKAQFSNNWIRIRI